MNDSEISDEKVEEKSDNEKKSEESVDEIKEQLIRLAADFDNYRKRIAKNAEQDRMRIKGEIVNPFLETVQSQSGLNAFRVVMDDTNNTADVVDRNQLVGQIFIQPTRTAEFIVLDFVVLPTGATFPA